MGPFAKILTDIALGVISRMPSIAASRYITVKFEEPRLRQANEEKRKEERKRMIKEARAKRSRL